MRTDRSAAPARRWPLVRFAGVWGLPPLLWQIAFFLGPLVLLFAMSFWSVRSFRLTPDATLANWTFLLNAGFFESAYRYSLLLGTATAFGISLVAFPAAYALAFLAPRGLCRAVQFMLIIPFFTNYPVRVYAWQVFITEEGILNTIISAFGFGTVTMIGTPGATLLGLATLTFPIVLLIQSVALCGVDRNLVQAAQNLGAKPLAVTLQIIVPAARPALVMAACIAFIMAFGDFIAPTLLGSSQPPTLSTLVSDQVRSGNHWPRASVVAVTMIATLAVVIALFSALAFAGRGKR